MKVSIKKSVLATVALTSLAGVLVSTNAAADESPWLVRVRMLYVDTTTSNSAGTVAGGPLNGATVNANTLKVSNRTQPEVDVSYFFTHNISAELIASSPLSHQVRLNGAYIGGFQELPPILNLQYHFDGMGAFVPYVGAGMVYMRTMNPSLTYPSGHSWTLQQSNFGEDLQLGADYKLDSHWMINADIKKTWVSVGLMGPDNGSTTMLQLHPDPYIFGLGVGYRF